METLLAVIGILGLGALLIATWVFVSAARRYVTGEEANARSEALTSDLSPYRNWTSRDRSDRRVARETPDFPIIIDGVVISRDRRVRPDRRGGRNTWIERSSRDRRRPGPPPVFPITVNGQIILRDRRSGRERRRGSVAAS
jgi:hypothetical protein